MTPVRWPRRKIARIGIGRPVVGRARAVRRGTCRRLARNSLKLPDTQYEPITWAMIDGWADDDHNAAFETFLKSCQAILKGAESRPGQPMYGALFKVCQKAVGPSRRSPARRARSSSRTSVRSASRRSARPTASSPATTSRSSTAPTARRRLRTSALSQADRRPRRFPFERQEKESASSASFRSTTAPRSTTARWPAAIWKSAG